MPTVRPIISQRIAPPKTSEAVTGAACPTTWLTSWRVTKDFPSERSTTSRFKKSPYW